MRQLFVAATPASTRPKVEHDLPPVRRAAMLEQIDALPGPKDHRAEATGMASCVCVSAVRLRGHVVQTFGFVDIALAVFGRDFLEKIFRSVRTSGSAFS